MVACRLPIAVPGLSHSIAVCYSQHCPTGFFKETRSNFPIANSVGRWLFPIDKFVTSAVGRWLFPIDKFVTSAVGRWLFPIDIYGEGVADRPGVRSSLATALPSATRSIALRAFVDGYQYEAKILFCAWLDADTRKQARMCVGTYTRTFPPHE